MERREECSSSESGWTKYIDPATSDDEDGNNYSRGNFVHRDHDHDDEQDDQHHHHHHGYNRRQTKDDDDDDDDSIASDASSGPGHRHGEEDDDCHGNKFSKGKKSTKVAKGRYIEKYDGKGNKKDMMLLKMKKSTGYGNLKQRQG